MTERPRKTWRLQSFAGDVLIVRRWDLRTGERVTRWSEQHVEQLVHESRGTPSIWQVLFDLYESVHGTTPGAGGAGGEALRLQVSRVVGAAFARGDLVVLQPEPVVNQPGAASPAAAPAPRPAPRRAPTVLETPAASSARASSSSC